MTQKYINSEYSCTYWRNWNNNLKLLKNYNNTKSSPRFPLKFFKTFLRKTLLRLHTLFQRKRVTISKSVYKVSIIFIPKPEIHLKKERKKSYMPVVKDTPTSGGDIRDAGSIPGSGRCPGEGNENPLQYSCLENSMDRGTWQAIIHRIAKSRT